MVHGSGHADAHWQRQERPRLRTGASACNAAGKETDGLGRVAHPQGPRPRKARQVRRHGGRQQSTRNQLGESDLARA